MNILTWSVFELLLVQGWEYDFKDVMLATGRIQAHGLLGSVQKVLQFCFTKYTWSDFVHNCNSELGACFTSNIDHVHVQELATSPKCQFKLT